MIGLLTKIYSYADIAYVGGAMGSTGLHNILEPATFGVPIIIGKNYDEFPEAERLRSLAGLFSITDEATCTQILTKFVEDSKFREKAGMISGHFINSNTGATTQVMDYISEVVPKT
jgi:3-deoxy-D-manno-octulosonic-acid transferase